MTTVGLEVNEVSKYLEVLDKNFYNKQIVLGAAKYAKAINSNNETVYEVVYSELVDDLVFNNTSIVKELQWPRDVPNKVGRTFYPNSLFNMKAQIASKLNSVANTSILPLWMRTIQENGANVGMTPNWVICYTKPGYGKIIADKFNEKYSLNVLNFEIDRFIVDKSLTHNYSTKDKTWYKLPSAGVQDDSKDEYVYFNQSTILK
jgi:hypothetical protein